MQDWHIVFVISQKKRKKAILFRIVDYQIDTTSTKWLVEWMEIMVKVCDNTCDFSYVWNMGGFNSPE